MVCSCSDQIIHFQGALYLVVPMAFSVLVMLKEFVVAQQTAHPTYLSISDKPVNKWKHVSDSKKRLCVMVRITHVGRSWYAL
jgi:hypothetical protein